MAQPHWNARNKSLPKFEPGFKINGTAARFDRMKISLELGTLPSANAADVHSLLRRVARRGRLFALDGSNIDPKISIRKQGWLFGGEIKATPHLRTGYSTVKAYLEINPTRHYAHHSFHRRARGREENPFLEPLKAVDAVTKELRGGTLDGNDNYIPASAIIAASRVDWYEYTATLLSDIRSAIQWELRSDPSTGMQLEPTEDLRWTIQQAEVYWEFEHPNATLAVEEFGERASASFKSSRRWIHTNAISYIFSTGSKKIWNSVYAKLPNRIRFECRFDTYPRKLFANDKRYRFSRFDRSNLDGFQDCLMTLAVAAREKIIPLSKIKNPIGRIPEPNLSDLSDHLLEIVSITNGKSSFMERMLHALLFTGKIASSDSSDERKIFANLVKKGLLEKAGRKPKNEPQLYSLSGNLRDLNSWLIFKSR